MSGVRLRELKNQAKILLVNSESVRRGRLKKLSA